MHKSLLRYSHNTYIFVCVQVSPIYTQTLKELRYGTRIIGHQGGQYSGKTVNILSALTTLCTEEQGGITTVTAQSFPHIKGGALRDFETYVYPDFRNAIKQYHKTDHAFTFKSGSVLEFKVFENAMSAHGAKRKRLFVNEAPTFLEEIWFQLNSRSDQSVIDYNPSLRFWGHDLIGKPGNKWVYSDHRHNPFLTPEKHAEIESYYDDTKPDGGERFKVYSRGITGNITGLIFPNWEMIDDIDLPDSDEDWVFCIDFGYTNDPTAIMKILLLGNTLYVKELCYQTGNIPPKQIRQILIGNGWRDNMNVYCDHDPDGIKMLRLAGIRYAIPARKGPGSINNGIDLLHTMDVKYSNLSQNLHREKSMYIWEVDKITGKPTNTPVDNNNHCFDAIRYGVYTRYLRNQLNKRA